MNRLDPDLKRLLRLSHDEASAAPAEAPFGFAGRVVAGWDRQVSGSTSREFSRLVSALAWCSAVVVIGCGLFLAGQTREPKLVSEFSTAAQFLAKTLAP